jgi:LacI family transcriptional regulator
MSTCIAVASQTFGSKFQGLIFARLRKCLRPDETILQCATIRRDDAEYQRAKMLEALESVPRPIALITICIRPDPRTIEAYRKARVPIVLIDDEAEDATTIASDNFAGGYLAGQHLIGTGKRSLALVSGPVRTVKDYNAVQRRSGFERALSEAGLELRDENLLEVWEYSRKDGLDAMARLLSEKGKLDAIFCSAGDACATGLLAGAKEKRIQVPEQLAVLGYDDSPLASIADPPLSSVRQPLDRIAREAHRLVTEEAAAILEKPRRVLFEPTLALRKTA